MNQSITVDKQLDRIQKMSEIQSEALTLFSKKNRDYGDSFATYGSIGVIIRMCDKVNRLKTIDKRGIRFVDDESLRDTLLDLHNYAAMAIMLMDENK